MLFRFTMNAETALSATGASLLEDVNATFRTVPYPAILRTSPDDGEQDAWPYGGFTIYFASADGSGFAQR